MNPEFERNLWLELTPRRVLQMVIVLGLIFLTLKVADPFDGRDRAAEFLFFAIVVIWGTREAAQSVVEEIRDRTWDFQRLSALTPFNMTWGELFGATSYIWLGGLICLAVMIAVQGSPVRPLNIFADLAIGLTAQSAALFASLLAVRRRQSITRLSVFQYQMFGIATAAAMWALWEPVANATMPIGISRVLWWNVTFDGRPFLAVSFALLLICLAAGCYRLMRLELQMQNRPLVWTGFIAIAAIYAAGFGRLPDSVNVAIPESEVALRLMAAALALLVVTYAAVLHEPKDRVLYRWLTEMAQKRRWTALLSRVQCWMIAYAATLLVGVFLLVRLQMMDANSLAHQQLIPLTIAVSGFLTRDLGIILYFALVPGQKRGDMPAIVALAALYGLGPQLLRSAGIDNPDFILPAFTGGWLGAAFAWAEAIGVWTLVFKRPFRTGVVSTRS